MSPAVEPTLSVEVNQVHEELFAHTADETGGMPANVGAEPGAVNCDITCHHHLAALQREKRKFCPRLKQFKLLSDAHPHGTLSSGEDFKVSPTASSSSSLFISISPFSANENSKMFIGEFPSIRD
jgi:hypothetical protein